MESEIKGKNYTDTQKIAKARERFKAKEYRESLKIYKTIHHVDTLSDFDLRTIDFLKVRVG